MKKIFAALLSTLIVCMSIAFVAPSAYAAVGDSASNPIVVTALSDVPTGAVEDLVSTYSTPAECDTTRSWVLTTPAVADTYYNEYRYKRKVNAVDRVSHDEWSIQNRTREYVPAVSHPEYRYPVETREFVPAVEGTTVYSYKKSVDDFKTKYQYQKQVKGVVQKKTGNSWKNDGTFDYEFWVKPTWNTNGTFQWSFDNVEVLESGGHSDTSNTYNDNKNRKVSTNYRYVKNGVTEQVKTGSHYEYSGEVTSPLGSPWVSLSGYPKTTGASDSYYTDWVSAGFTDWSTDSTKPGDTDTVRYGEVEETSVEDAAGYWTEWTEWNITEERLLSEPTIPANTDTLQYQVIGPYDVEDSAAVPAYTEYYVEGSEPSRKKRDASWIKESSLEGWNQFDEREMSNNDGTPEVVTYYAYSDGKVCDVVVPPVPPVTPEPPVVTPEPPVVVVPPVVIKNPLAPPVVIKVPVKKTVKKTVEVPTAVDAGLSSTKVLPNTGSGDILGGLAATGIVLVGLGALALRRRRVDDSA